MTIMFITERKYEGRPKRNRKKGTTLELIHIFLKSVNGKHQYNELSFTVHSFSTIDKRTIEH